MDPSLPKRLFWTSFTKMAFQMALYVYVVTEATTIIIIVTTVHASSAWWGLKETDLAWSDSWPGPRVWDIVFIHLYSTSLSMSHSEALPTTALILCRS